MNKAEAQQRVDAAIKELEAAKAALAASEQEPASGRTVMKPSEVPVGEYFKFVDDKYSSDVCLSCYNRQHLEVTRRARVLPISLHDDKPVYLTDPYGNAIEPREKLPYGFSVHMAHMSIADDPTHLSETFDFSDTREGFRYWEGVCLGKKLSPSAAAKLRGMIHKWNQENGGQG